MNHFFNTQRIFCRSAWQKICSLGIAGMTFSSLLVSCKTDVPEGVIPESTMEKLLYDYHVAQALAEIRTDSINYYRYLYVRSVFDKYGIDEATFDSSMVWYSANASLLAEMYTRINERYAAELKALGSSVNNADLYHSLTASGDTANIWHDADFCLLRPAGINTHYSFTIEADTSFYPGDDILWRFNNFFVYQEGVRDAYAALTVRFDNDSVTSAYKYLTSNSSNELSIKVSGKEKIRSLTGFVYLTSSDGDMEETFRMMILNDFKLIRFHKKPDDLRTDSTETVKKDSLDLQKDSLQTDSAGGSKLPARGPQERISPKELRDNRSVERTIRVVKEKPYSVRRRR